MYETGGMRRVHLRGRENILKRLLIQGAAFNLSLILRKTIGVGKPRQLQGLCSELFALFGTTLQGIRMALEAAIRLVLYFIAQSDACSVGSNETPPTPYRTRLAAVA
jgi:hypothetical protein